MPSHCQIKIPEKFLSEVRYTFPYSLVCQRLATVLYCRVATRKMHRKPRSCVLAIYKWRKKTILFPTVGDTNIPPQEAAWNQDLHRNEPKAKLRNEVRFNPGVRVERWLANILWRFIEAGWWREIAIHDGTLRRWLLLHICAKSIFRHTKRPRESLGEISNRTKCERIDRLKCYVTQHGRVMPSPVLWTLRVKSHFGFEANVALFLWISGIKTRGIKNPRPFLFF